MTNNQPQELLPCPFCGGKPNLWNREGSFQVTCSICDARGHLWETRPPNQNEEMAAEKWNTRHTPTPPLLEQSETPIGPAKETIGQFRERRSKKVLGTPPLPTDLAKAIDEVERISFFGQLSKASKDTLLNAAKRLQQIESATGTDLSHLTFSLQLLTHAEQAEKQVQELQEHLNETHSHFVNETSRHHTTYTKLKQLEQSSRDDKALVEELMEQFTNGRDALSQIARLANINEATRNIIIGVGNHFNEALQFAHSKGYGKKG